MATTKLTLSIPQDIVNQAKIFSKASKVSLSAMVSRYFSNLPSPKKVKQKKVRVSKNVKKLTGLVKVNSNKSDEELLWTALEDKYL